MRRNMNEITVLSTACAAMFMPGFFSCLKENGERNIKIIGVDIVDDAFMGNWLDKYYKVPKFTDPTYVDVLIEICKKEKVDIFFPHISMELPLILKDINKFKAIGVKVAITENSTLRIANNKLELYRHLEQIGIMAPKYFQIFNSKDLVKYAKKLGFPKSKVVVKLAESSGSRGVRVVNNKIDRKANFYNKPNSLDVSMKEMCLTIDECGKLPDIFVMEFLPGCEYTVDLLADKGKTIFIAGRHNYESVASIAMSSVTEKNEEAFNICRKIVAYLHLDGNIGFDFLFDENGKPVLTDLNPRVTATVVLFKQAGLNLPYLRIKQLLGEELPKCEVVDGVKMKRRYIEIFD